MKTPKRIHKLRLFLSAALATFGMAEFPALAQKAGDPNKAPAPTPEEIDSALTLAFDRSQPDPRTIPYIASRKPFKRDLHFFQQRAFPLGKFPGEAYSKAVTGALTYQSRRGPRDHVPGGAHWGKAGNPSGWYGAGPSPINGGQVNSSYNQNVTGRISALAVVPGQPSHWFAGSALGGVWETMNAGDSWTPRTDNQESLSIGALAISRSQPQTMYAGTGESVTSPGSYAGTGVLKSTNGGASWELTGREKFLNNGISELRVDPGDPAIVVATSNGAFLGRGSPTTPPAIPDTLVKPRGIFKTDSGGASWTKKFPAPAAGTAEATDLEADPQNFNNLYAAISSGSAGVTKGVYRSGNAGDTWDLLPGPWTTEPAVSANIRRIEMAIAPVDPDVMFVSICDSRNGGLLDIWRTANLRQPAPAWLKLPFPAVDAGLGDGSLITPGTQLWYDHQLIVDPADSRILYFGAVNFWVYNGQPGANPVWRDTKVNTDGPIHADQHAMAWTVDSAGINYRLILGNDGGVWYSDNRAASWVNCNNGLSITQFYDGAIHPWDGNFAISGAQDNGTSIFTGTINWKWLDGGDGCAAAISPQFPDTHWILSSQYLSMLKVHDGGEGGRALYDDADGGAGNGGGIDDNGDGNEPQNAPFISRFAMHPANENIVIAGTDNLWKCTDFFVTPGGTPTWSRNSPDFRRPLFIGETAPPSDRPIGISAMAFAPSDPTGNTYAFGLEDGKLRITTQGGGTADKWRDLDPDGGVPNRYVTSIMFDPRNAAIVYVTLSGFDEGTVGKPGHLFKTGNATEVSAVWTDISQPAADGGNIPHNSLTMDPAQPHVIYAGTDIGILECTQHPDGSRTWRRFWQEDGLPNVPVFDLKFHRRGRRLMAFTFGRGLFYSDLLPAHDLLGGAEVLSGASGARSSSNIGATDEPGEPTHIPSATGNHSVWYKWTPDIGGTATISTSGSNFDTVMAVYEQNATPGSWNFLDQPAVVLDDDSGGNKTSRVTFTAMFGKTYLIAVDGYLPTDTGEISLAWSIEDTVPPSSTVNTPGHQSFIQSLVFPERQGGGQRRPRPRGDKNPAWQRLLEWHRVDQHGVSDHARCFLRLLERAQPACGCQCPSWPLHCHGAGLRSCRSHDGSNLRHQLDSVHRG